MAFFYPNFTFRVPKSIKNPGVGGFTDLGKPSPKKRLFLDGIPNSEAGMALITERTSKTSTITNGVNVKGLKGPHSRNVTEHESVKEPNSKTHQVGAMFSLSPKPSPTRLSTPPRSLSTPSKTCASPGPPLSKLDEVTLR